MYYVELMVSDYGKWLVSIQSDVWLEEPLHVFHRLTIDQSASSKTKDTFSVIRHHDKAQEQQQKNDDEVKESIRNSQNKV